MRRRWAILICPLLLAAAPESPAYQLRLGEGTNTLAVPADQRFESETLLMAHGLEVEGRADRDLWMLASTSIRFAGDAEGDLRMAARSAVVSGLARRNLFAYAGGLQLATSSVVRGEAALFGADVICEGLVEGDAWIFARSVTIGGRWNGNLRVHAEEIRIVPGTSIAGHLVYTAPKAPVIGPSVTIGGAVESRPAFLPEGETFAPASMRNRFMLHGYLYLAALLAGMPFVGFFPVLAGSAVRRLRTSPWRVLAAGFLAVAGGPFLIAFAVMSIVGIPLAVLLGAVYLLLAYLAHVIVALWLGHLLLRSPGPQSFGQVLFAMATGLFVLYFAAALPGVASLLLLPVTVIGAGALLTARLPLRPPLPPPPTAFPPPDLPKQPQP